MTKEEFELELLNHVLYYKNNLEQMDLGRVYLEQGLVSKSNKLKYNPFVEFESKYFNIKLLSNIEGLNRLLISNTGLNIYQVKLFISGNPKFVVLQDVMNFNRYFVEELSQGISTPMDIAIDYAKHCKQLDKIKHTHKR